MHVDWHRMSTRAWGKAIGLGFATAAILAGLNLIALKTHASPLPEPLGLAFAETLFGRSLPLFVGLLFHVLWVTFFSVVYVALWRDRMTFGNATKLALFLWLLAVTLFFPIVGWGFLGFAVGPKLLLPVTVSHLLFAAILWILAGLIFGGNGGERAPHPRDMGHTDRAATRDSSLSSGPLLLASGGAAAAFCAASCCGLPVLLGSIGLGSGWLVTLAWIAAPHRIALLILACMLLAGSAGAMVWRRRVTYCKVDSVSPSVAVNLLMIGTLLIGTILGALGYFYT